MEQTFTWIANIINSCKNEFHFHCVDLLISLFTVKYGDCEMLLRLKELRKSKWLSIQPVLIY